MVEQDSHDEWCVWVGLCKWHWMQFPVDRQGVSWVQWSGINELGVAGSRADWEVGMSGMLASCISGRVDVGPDRE